VGERLRVGVLLDGELAPVWVVRMLERMAAMPDVDIALVLTAGARPSPAPEDLGDWDGATESLLWQCWLGLERLLYRGALALFQMDPLPTSMRAVSRLSIPDDAVPEAAPMSMLRHLRQLELDVLVQLGAAQWGAPLCGVANFGLWRLRSGDPQRARRGPPCFWEVVRGDGATAMCLERLVPDLHGGQVLAEGAFTSDDHSVLQNRVAHYLAGSELLLRELRALAALGGDAWLERLAQGQGGVVPFALPGRGMPSAAGTLGAFLRVYGRLVARKLRQRLSREQWLLAFSLGSRQGPDTSLSRFRRITPPVDRIWADPFVFHRRGRWFVFFEELLHRESRGVLACLELRADGGWTEPRRVLERPYHLSYPNVFELGGEVYLLPETSEARCVELYRAVEFPWRWERVRTLIEDVELVDPTVWQQDGRWWLFGNVRTVAGTTLQDMLHLYFTDDLLQGAWQSHPENPIVIDATSARPAGQLYVQDGRVIRPAQDSTTRYGHALKLFEVLELTTTSYRERLVQRFTPDWAGDLIGLHTLNHAEGVTVVDLLRRHWR
jgi:hypothetical protein